VTETDYPETQPSGEGKLAEAIENSATATTTHPLARDLYDWASRLTAEAGGLQEYYWTPQIERLVTKLKLTKRALIGVVGVQGVGKNTAAEAFLWGFSDENSAKLGCRQ
jgi:putative protein kinase ArgK-like GTPase of G3E family